MSWNKPKWHCTTSTHGSPIPFQFPPFSLGPRCPWHAEWKVWLGNWQLRIGKSWGGSGVEVGKCRVGLANLMLSLIFGTFRLSTGTNVQLCTSYAIPAHHDSNSDLARAENNSIHLSAQFLKSLGNKHHVNRPMGTLLTRLPTQQICMEIQFYRENAKKITCMSESGTQVNSLGLGLPGHHGRVGKNDTIMEPDDDRDRGTGSIAKRAWATNQTFSF